MLILAKNLSGEPFEAISYNNRPNISRYRQPKSGYAHIIGADMEDYQAGTDPDFAGYDAAKVGLFRDFLRFSQKKTFQLGIPEINLYSYRRLRAWGLRVILKFTEPRHKQNDKKVESIGKSVYDVPSMKFTRKYG